jgi:hypothetical protein
VIEERASPRAGRRLSQAARYVLGILLGVVVLVLLFGKRGDLAASWHQLGRVSFWWITAAIGAEALSLWIFAYLQQRVLRLSGTRIALPALYLLTLANDAIAGTVPGEPAVSSAYRYRYYRRHGASSASAGWTVFTILIAQAIGMSLLLLAGVVVALGASTSAAGAGVAILALVVIVGAGAILMRRDLVLRLAARQYRRAGGIHARADARDPAQQAVDRRGGGAGRGRLVRGFLLPGLRLPRRARPGPVGRRPAGLRCRAGPRLVPGRPRRPGHRRGQPGGDPGRLRRGSGTGAVRRDYLPDRELLAGDRARLAERRADCPALAPA